jgi:hypothetical protein
MSTKTIICPNCKTKIDIDEVFYHQVEQKLKQKHLQMQKQLQDEIEAKRKEYKEYFNKLKQKEELLLKEQEEFNKKIEAATKQRLLEERKKLYNQIKQELTKEQEESIKLLQDELEQKSKQLAELNKAKIEIERLKRQNKEIELKAQLEAEAKFNEKIELEKKKMQELLEELNKQKLKELQEAQELKLKEKEEQIKQMQRALEEAKRKAEQSSMQIQGEALEVTIESYLKQNFPFDIINEVKKGAFGADCIQIVNTKDFQNCGVICYESKNTKAWNKEWISKLKQDMLKVNADIGVLVTSVYPQGMNQMGFVDGIWVCSLTEFKGSVALLRDGLIKAFIASKKEENKTDKMTLLYNYLTGNEFQMQLRAIVDGFVKMQEELEKEKRSLMASWKRRQKLIDNVLLNTTQMYGSLQAIAGSGAIEKIDLLELLYDNEE